MKWAKVGEKFLKGFLMGGLSSAAACVKTGNLNWQALAVCSTIGAMSGGTAAFSNYVKHADSPEGFVA